MKRVSLLTLLIAAAFTCFAQSNFYKFSIGGGAGITQSFTEVNKHDFGLAGYGTIDYLLTPFISIGLEGQKGEINSGDYHTDPLNRQSTNSYLAGSVNGKIALGEFADYRRDGLARALKGLYLGAGIGAIRNSTKSIVNNPVYAGGGNGQPQYLVAANSDKEIFFPLNLGINFYFADRDDFYRYVLNFNYQANITLGEGLDGYDETSRTFKTGNPDIYTFFSVGLKYNFGKMGLSRKTFRR